MSCCGLHSKLCPAHTLNIMALRKEKVQRWRNSRSPWRIQLYDWTRSAVLWLNLRDSSSVRCSNSYHTKYESYSHQQALKSQSLQMLPDGILYPSLLLVWIPEPMRQMWSCITLPSPLTSITNLLLSKAPRLEVVRLGRRQTLNAVETISLRRKKP